MAKTGNRRTSKRSERDQDAFKRLFEEKRHVGGRLPDITQPHIEETPEAQAEPEAASSVSPLETQPPDAVTDEATPEMAPLPPADPSSPADPPHSWKTGLTLVTHTVQQYGFTHPYSDNPGYLMVPPEFEAVLSIENKACCQILFRIMRETIGQADVTKPKDEFGRHPRREWAVISHQSFSAFCGMTPGQVNRGIKLALQKGYILRRKTMVGYEYALRWKDPDELPE
ncbi:MAG: hypothetical protein ETSY1_46950 (plasmid) [Candidatus Entotheonella factor]|uniref:Uncharacterized protein n=1 Tax=Entotheonella factor TaxID=1429438 RepID=W4M036_ENTF1|nr:MAG: hypothetical protein ETSY1_46950 [Candidatus Entotheonella factor]